MMVASATVMFHDTWLAMVGIRWRGNWMDMRRQETPVEMSRFTLPERGVSGDTASCCSCIEYEDRVLDIEGEEILSSLGRLLTESGIDQIRSRTVYQQPPTY